MKAYEQPVSYGTDRRFGVAKNSKRGHNRAGMTVTITGVRATDQGKYYCGIDKTGNLALLQKAELRVNTSCWLCLEMSHSWKAAPLTVATVT